MSGLNLVQIYADNPITVNSATDLMYFETGGLDAAMHVSDFIAANATAAAHAPLSGITGLGTGVATALAINVGSAGAPVLFNGAGGTPSSMTATNLTGTAAGLTAGTASAVAVGGITGLGTGVATALGVNVGSAGAFVTFNGALGTPSSGTLTSCTGLPIAGGGTGGTTQTTARGNLGIPFGNQTVCTAATTTFTTNSTTTTVFVRVWGDGGGGGTGSAGTGAAGGGSGAYCEGFVTVSASTAYTMTVGQGGAAGVSGTGSTAVFGGTTLSAGGGTHGANNGPPVAGGTASGGSLNLSGQQSATSNVALPGNGGCAPMGGAGGLGTGAANGNAGVTPGGGGGGGQSGTAGGAGAPGLIIVYF